MRRFSRFGFVRRRASARESQALMQDLNLRPLNIERPIGQFSGGNQQKAIIGRWIAAGARIFLFDEPTRGIDVGAKAEIHAELDALVRGPSRDPGARAILLVSSDLDELLSLCDRVAVMVRGRLGPARPASGLDRRALLLEASGGAP